MSGRPLVDWTWIVEHLDDIAFRTVQHLWLAAIAVAAGFVIAFALSLLALRFRRSYGPITGIAGVLYTIPSLAMFAGAGPDHRPQPADRGDPADPLHAADLRAKHRGGVRRGSRARCSRPPTGWASRAAGASGRSSFRSRSRLIITGLRLASVSTIGLVMIVSLIGDNFGGLGLFIKEGIQTFFPTQGLRRGRAVPGPGLRRGRRVRGVGASDHALVPSQDPGIADGGVTWTSSRRESPGSRTRRHWSGADGIPARLFEHVTISAAAVLVGLPDRDAARALDRPHGTPCVRRHQRRECGPRSAVLRRDGDHPAAVALHLPGVRPGPHPDVPGDDPAGHPADPGKHLRGAPRGRS